MVIKFDKHFLLYIYWLSLHPVAKSPDLSWRGAQLISDTHIHAHALTHIYIAWQITTKEYHIHYIVYLCLSMNHLFMKFYIVKISIRFCMKWFFFNTHFKRNRSDLNPRCLYCKTRKYHWTLKSLAVWNDF